MEKIKDVLYDVSDFLLTLIIILVIIIAITFVMSRTFDLDLQKESIFDFISGKDPQSSVVAPVTNEPNKTPTATEEPKTIEAVLPTSTETSSAPTPAQTPTESMVLEVVFNEGDAPSVFADKLLSAGVIKSADDFINALIEKGADTNLQPGTFKFKRGMSLDEVIRVLTQ